ncbi:hypothetical protein [Sinomonas humi]|uniref:hypothetical protein n=1 Tax=Sinomonas humi TaxID=1338436 RepID=UPI0018CDCD21|nr:hypothetical protein [Sinomonas humi]
MPRRGIDSISNALWIHLTHSRYLRMAANVSWLLITGSVVVAALRIGGLRVEEFPLGRNIDSLLTWLAFMAGLTVADFVSRDNGAVVLIPRLRFMWESGADVRTVVAAVLIGQTAFAVTLVSPGAILLGWAVDGVPFWMAAPIVASTAAATILGGSLSRTTFSQADGSAEPSLASALITFLSAVPAAGTALAPRNIGLIGSVLYTLVLIGIAALCLRRRILHLPSSSSRSQPAM